MQVRDIVKQIENHNGRKLDLNKQSDRARLFITINRILNQKDSIIFGVQKALNIKSNMEA